MIVRSSTSLVFPWILASVWSCSEVLDDFELPMSWALAASTAVENADAPATALRNFLL
ncbi:hypothetical protein ACFFQF_20810 [Haladaptatus pallidirubidus]|uniref:hypothetical protein n=1 Tax=Haladaptatus pallidirubidus TaxID=1008152 RepID=UPI0035E8A32A